MVNSLKIGAVILVFVLLWGGMAVYFNTPPRRDATNVEGNMAGGSQKEESYDQMMARMHPGNTPADDMSSHHAPAKPVPASDVESLVGKPAPDFSLESLGGGTVRLSELKGKTVILFFNEGAMCYPACWDQIRELSLDQRLNNDKVASFSIVVDPKSEWQKISSQVPSLSKANILFDTGKTTAGSYQVMATASSMHKGSTPGHTYFIIDPQGIISFAFDDPSMALNNKLLADKLPPDTLSSGKLPV